MGTAEKIETKPKKTYNTPNFLTSVFTCQKTYQTPNVLICVYMYLNNEKIEIERLKTKPKRQKLQDENQKRERKKERLNKYHPHLCPRLCT